MNKHCSPWFENEDGRIEDSEGTEVAKVIVIFRPLVAAAPEMAEALEMTYNVINNILTDSQLDTRTVCGQTIRQYSQKVEGVLKKINE